MPNPGASIFGALFSGGTPPAPRGLSVRGLTLARAKRIVLEDISFSAQPGEITALLGESGAGKTTLLAGIAGLLKPVRGAVLAGNTDVTRLRAGKRFTGFLPPGTTLDSGTLAAASNRHGSRAGQGQAHGQVQGHARGPARAQSGAILEAFGVAPATLVTNSTHGEAIAALTAARLLPPGPILLIDEAGAGLSRQARGAMLAWLRAQARLGRTIVIATRDDAVALAADHLVLLQGGRVLQAGAPASLRAEPRDETVARLTGPANILRGTVRQKLPGGFVWVAAGHRFTQADNPAQPAPALGADIALCLRPAQALLGAAGGPNRLEGQVEAVVCDAAGTAIICATALGALCVLIQDPGAIRAGMTIHVGWDTAAAILLPG